MGECAIPMLVLNVVYPLVPGADRGLLRRQARVLVVEEGQPEFIEQEIGALLRRAGVAATLRGKDVLPHERRIHRRGDRAAGLQRLLVPMAAACAPTR